MSSFARTAVPIGLAVAFGIWNGYYAFNPAFKEHQVKPSQSLTKGYQQTEEATKVEDLAQQNQPRTDTSPNH